MGREHGFTEVGGHRLEHVWIPARRAGPTVVLLHEGLGSVALWKDFPERVAAATGLGVFLYSRYGYGRSTPCTTHPVGPRYMHREALDVLPAVLDAQGIERPILVGHSDGGSIALLHAGGCARPVAGVLTLAAHVFTESICVQAIETAKLAFEAGRLRKGLAPYHDDVDGAFSLWNQAWLDPVFRAWNIESFLPGVRCPVVAVQGADDAYGTEEQLVRIARGVSGPVETRVLPACGHSAWRDQPEAVLAALDTLIGRAG